MTEETKSETKPESTKINVAELIFAFICPTLIGKSLVLYFGLNYSESPGEGYGVGLALSVAFTLFMLGRFFWRYRNYVD